MVVYEEMKDVAYEAISHDDFEKRAAQEQKTVEPTNQPVEDDNKINTKAEAAKQAGKRPAETYLVKTSRKKPKTNPNAEPLRCGKRRAEERLDREDIKKRKRATASHSGGPSSPTSSCSHPGRRKEPWVHLALRSPKQLKGRSKRLSLP